MKIAIDSIIVDDPRREELGDIEGLAASIKEYGLLHPIIVDSDRKLVCGFRRLNAVRSLGWTEVEATNLGDLSPSRRRLIELEENLRRKDLSEIEQSKDYAEATDVMREVLREEARERAAEYPQTIYKNSVGKPSKPDSLDAIAERLGVTRPTLTNAERHVAAVAKYPILDPLPMTTALKLGKAFDKYPELQTVAAKPQQLADMARTLDQESSEQRIADRQALTRSDSDTITRLAGLPPMPKTTDEEKERDKAIEAMRSWQGWLTKSRDLLEKVTVESVSPLARYWTDPIQGYSLECVAIIRRGLDAIEPVIIKSNGASHGNLVH